MDLYSLLEKLEEISEDLMCDDPAKAEERLDVLIDKVKSEIRGK
jgi:hypothetical protein